MAPKKVTERLAAGLRRFQSVLTAAQTRDITEADTVTIVKDVLAEIFGYDKYEEVTSEFAIRGTWCDLAIKIDAQMQYLIEVKAIGIQLKDQHVKQAIDYAANKGVDWAVLTNGVTWRVYRVVFAKPIDFELILDVDLLQLSPRSAADLETLYLLSREGISKSALPEFHAHRQATSRFLLGAILTSDAVLDVVRRELRRISPDVRVDAGELRAALEAEVLKREVVEGEKAEEARKRVSKAASRALRAKAAAKAAVNDPESGFSMPEVAVPIVHEQSGETDSS